MRLDNELRIIISNQKANYDRTTDRLSYSLLTVSKFRKNGYIVYNEEKESIGIVFKSDDKRTLRYGNAEIMFFKKHESMYGSWRIIKTHGQYLPYNWLETLFENRHEYITTTDARYRKD